MPLPLQLQLDSFFRNGIPIEELHCSAPQRKQLQVIISAWDFYRQNPWQTNMRPYFKKLGRTPSQITQDIQYFQYIKDNFSLTTRADAQAMVDYAARTVLQSAAAQGDRGDLIKAAALLTKVHQLDKPVQQEALSANTATLPMFLVSSPKSVNQEAIEYTDDELEKQMLHFGAAINPLQQKINQRTRELRESPESND